MKVIGMADQRIYICEVSHSELEKFLDLYYGNLKTLKVGSEVDLGKGYDFAGEVKAACASMRDVIQKNASVVRALTQGITFLGQMNIEQEKQDG